MGKWAFSPSPPSPFSLPSSLPKEIGEWKSKRIATIFAFGLSGVLRVVGHFLFQVKKGDLPFSLPLISQLDWPSKERPSPVTFSRLRGKKYQLLLFVAVKANFFFAAAKPMSFLSQGQGYEFCPYVVSSRRRRHKHDDSKLMKNSSGRKNRIIILDSIGTSFAFLFRSVIAARPPPLPDFFRPSPPLLLLLVLYY